MTAAKKTKELKQSDPEFLPTQYNLTEAAIKKLKKDYDPALIPDTEKKGDEGYLVVHEKVMSITKVRTAIEKKRKELKADALSWGRLVDGKAKELTEIIEVIENPWKELKSDLDDKEAREAEEARVKEVERIQIIEAKVEQLKGATNDLVGKDVAALKNRLGILSAVVIDESYGEYTEAAQLHKDTGIGKLDAAIAEREVFEEQQAQLKVSQDKLAAQQKEIDDAAAKVEEDRLKNEAEAQRLKDEEETQIAAEKQRKEDEAFAELQETQRKAKEHDDAEAKKVRDAELDKRLPEDVKIRAYLSGLRSVEIPEIKNEEMVKVMTGILMKMDEISDFVYANTQEQSGI